MNPNTAFSVSLVTSLVLWFPSMQACLRGDLDLTPAALRYLAALTVSRLAMNFLAGLLDAYRGSHQPEMPSGEAPAADSETATAVTPPAGRQRRRGDRQADDGAADPASLAA